LRYTLGAEEYYFASFLRSFKYIEKPIEIRVGAMKTNRKKILSNRWKN